jgi:hypothetical protein
MNTSQLNRWIRLSLIASLTLGLAPFFPEPHIVGKVRWVMGGAQGMQSQDYVDLFLHGTPWAALIVLVSLWFIKKLK